VQNVGFKETKAHVLAQRIREYWAVRGYEVDVWVDKFTLSDITYYVVRSDMINGKPRHARQSEEPGTGRLQADQR
jgi:hypothetical protein